MTDLWLPTDGLGYAPLSEIAPGSFLLNARNDAGFFNLGIAVRGFQGGMMVLCLTKWLSGAIAAGNLITDYHESLFFLPPSTFKAVLEIDAGAESIEAPSMAADLSGCVALTGKGPRLMATANGHAPSQRVNRVFDVTTWEAVDLAGVGSARAHTTAWRLRFTFADDRQLIFASPAS